MLMTFKMLDPNEIRQNYLSECRRYGVTPDENDYQQYLDALEASMRPDPDFNL